MSENWDDYAEEWNSNEDTIFYANKAFETLKNVVDLDGLNILDFGCGTGLLTERMSPLANHIYALDPSEKMISVLNSKKLPNVTTLAKLLTESMIEESQFASAKFDLIVASSVCAFLPAYEQTLSLLKTLLCPGGIIVQWDWLAPENNSEYGLSEKRMRDAYECVGLLLLSIDQPFTMIDSKDKGTMPVLMGVAKMPNDAIDT
jgi:predicted TPR repeat methyltransferase